MTTPLPKLHVGLLWVYGIFTMVCCSLALIWEMMPLAVLPALVPVIWVGVRDFSLLYFVLLFFLPLAMELGFTSSLATDFPTEPLMIGLMLITFAYLATNKNVLPGNFYNHPLLLILLLHIAWFFIAAINALNFTVAIKIFVAKIWYVTVFIYLTAIVINSYKRLQAAVWCIYIPLLFTAIVTMIRHAMKDFGFEEINSCVTPFFINHVNYALMLVVFYPFIWLAATWYPKGSWQRNFLNFGKIFFLIAIYFSYTRAAMISAILMVPFLFVIKWRFMKIGLAIAGVVALVGVGYLVENNRFLKYAPDESTIYHDEFGDHINATFEGKDVSSMERVYRWIAGARMIQDRPLMGVGPGNFYPTYKQYVVASFETWVSDNEERSTVHNYFLLLWIEQGIVGLLLFVALTASIFIVGENTYHRLKSLRQKNVIMASLLSLMAIYFSLTLNDMLETDKIGTLFFFNISLILILAVKGLPDSEGEQS